MAGKQKWWAIFFVSWYWRYIWRLIFNSYANYTHTIDLYPPHFHPIYQSQQTLGWKQLYYSQLLKQWTQYLVTHHPHLDPLCTLTKMLSLMWNHLLDIWKSQNEDNKAATIQFPPNMLSNLHGIYMAHEILLLHIQNQIFHITKEELLTKPKNHIQTWIQQTKPYIQTELKILAKQQWTHNQDIWLFFPIHWQTFPCNSASLLY